MRVGVATRAAVPGVIGGDVDLFHVFGGGVEDDGEGCWTKSTRR
ncbi:hypothetical protein [Streptomyces sp. NPDC055186]